MLSRQMWMVADRCNLTCTYCYFETGEYHYRPNGLMPADYRRWLEQCTELEQVESVALTGGEPLLRPDLFDLLAVARAFADTVHVFTNAVRVTDDIAAKWARLGCAADVSIDHMSQSITDQVRGGTKATLAGIDRLDAAGVPLQIVMVVTSRNWTDVGPVCRRARERGWSLELLMVSVPPHHPLSLCTLDERERGTLLGVIDEWREMFASRTYYARVRHFLETGRLPYVRSCATGEYGVFVNSDGDVWVCAHRDRPLGNIRNATAAAITDAKREALIRQPAGPCAGLGCLSLTQ